ncbi:MAG TPA: TolC family protein [Candidatus Acidoferrales bacterium]|jgi:HAE1 family hydrophobic/amphiphilic exporter-1|nr:TolC family protein [Candidatus Acidoferrales bacterium]
MRRFALFVCFALAMGFASGSVRAQSSPFPTPQWFREVTKRPPLPSQIPAPEHVVDFVVDGKLRLTLEQAIQLALGNNTNVRIDELTYQNQAFNILSAKSPFDSSFNSSFSASRSSTQQSTALGGAPVVSALSQTFQSTYSQLFETGTSLNVGLGVSRLNNNSSFDTFNPSLPAYLIFTVSQPLLRNRGLFPNRAPILIAQRNLHESRATFQAQVSLIIENVVSQYWNVVLARESLSVDRKSVEQAQASYDHDKRALELGGIGPYDIFQSESQLATRKVAVIQAEYFLKEQEDALRLQIGADLDPKVMALDMDLTEAPEPTGELLTVDVGQVIEKAHAKRPEYDVYRDTLAIDDMNIRLAHNQMQPSLGLSGFYEGSSLAGDQIDNNTTPPTIISATGLGYALAQAAEFTSPTYGFTLSLNLPIKNRAAEASLGTSQVSKRRDLYNQRSNEESIVLEARTAINQLEVAKLSLAEAKIALDLSQKNLEGEQRKYELGTDSLFVLLQTQLQQTAAEQTLVQAEVTYQLALVAVDHATGELLEKHNVQIHDPKQ